MDANLGINVIGQCYHDGGPLVLVLYAVLLGTFLRVVDELLVSRPGNPYVLAMFCASCSHFIAWPRGAISGYSLLLGCFFVFMLLVNWGGRIVFGSGLVYQSPTNSRLATSPRYSRAMPAT